MIKLGVQTAGIQGDYSIDETYRIIHETGFDAADANIDELFPPEDIQARKISSVFSGSDKEFLSHVKPWREAAQKYHVENYQAHAILPSSLYCEDPYNDYLIEVLQKNIVCCDYIQCRNLIVHPFFYSYELRLNPEQEMEMNIERYSRLIPQAKMYGVKICLENMFLRHGRKIYCGCCGIAEEACRYVDELNRIAGTECFGFCLDTGHLLLGGQTVRQAMHTLGKRICAFHVHDNNGVEDQHLAPYLGIMDWDGFVQGLADIKYDRTMCFETFRSLETVAPPLRKPMLQYIYQAGKSFVEQLESDRKRSSGR